MAHLPSAEGLVEIPTAFVERVEGEARKVTIAPEEEIPSTAADKNPTPEKDRLNYPALVKKVRLRDGQVCANPGCRRRGICHVHHLEFRANGGRTAVYNEILLCRICHALVHAGLLKIEGDPVNGLRWITACDQIKVDLSAELRGLAAIPSINLSFSSAGVDGSGYPPSVFPYLPRRRSRPGLVAAARSPSSAMRSWGEGWVSNQPPLPPVPRAPIFFK